MPLNQNQMVTQMLKTIHDAVVENTDQESSDNELIQFFEAPYDPIILKAFLNTYINGSSITETLNELTKLLASMSTNVVDPSTLCWGGYDANGVYHSPNFKWGYGGVYK